jgi:hypothetical protein
MLAFLESLRFTRILRENLNRYVLSNRSSLPQSWTSVCPSNTMSELHHTLDLPCPIVFCSGPGVTPTGEGLRDQNKTRQA